jgi:transcriptional regulator with XRE-family HTH domain
VDGEPALSLPMLGLLRKRNKQATGSPRDIARRLRRFREAAALTQETVARRAGVTAKFISEIENAHVNPSVEVVARLVEDGLSIPLSAFFADDQSDEIRGDLAQLAALFGAQTPIVRRRALRVLKAICEE